MIVEASLAHGIDALIVSNTTLERPLTLKSAFAGQAGGLSGAPLKPFAQKALEAAAEAAGGRLPLIAVGGIESGADAWARIRAGASAVQIYSALIYDGPGLVGAIKRDLAARLRAEGFRHISDAVGAGR
ncbi:Dihydroorotate dehydrogenase [compost metagenome]